MATTTTPTPGAKSGMANARRFQLRPWIRAIHRDAGYFVIGLTLVYALPGLAVNHIAVWDPSVEQLSRTHQVKAPLPNEPERASRQVLSELGVGGTPREIYAAEDGTLHIEFDRRSFHVSVASGRVVEEGQSPRWFLRAANWLHLNRGKKAWTYAADAYAVLLLYLALSGLFMIPGRKGLIGRGAIIAAIGAAVPIGYVAFSGGPEAKGGSTDSRAR